MSREQDFSPKLQPLPHQVEAIRYVVTNLTAAIFDEQGLGKTKIVIDALARAMRDGQIQGALVVAPLSLVYTWEQEVIKHSHLKPIVLRGTTREKKYRILTGANFYIINYESVCAEIQRMKRFCRSRPIAIVLDEAARIKNPKTKTAQALFELAPLSVKRVIVTGTPVANKPVDLWAQYFFLDQGKTLGDSYAEFASRYNEEYPDYTERITELRRLVRNNSIRRLKNDVLTLPQKEYRITFVELKGQQLEMYNRLRKQLCLEITNKDGDEVLDECEYILKRLLRLIQIASNPKLIDRSFEDVPAKFPVLTELIDKIVQAGEKAIIWSCFVENIMILKRIFMSYNPLVIYGGVPISERSAIVHKFQNYEKYRVLIANPAAAREGLTLTRANHAIYLDRNFSLIDYIQSQDRIHRISQTRSCIINKIIARNTIDEYIDMILELKSDIASFIEGDKQQLSKRSLQTLLTKRDLLNMLGG